MNCTKDDVNFLLVSTWELDNTTIRMTKLQNTNKIKWNWWDEVAQPCNPNVWEAEAGGLRWVLAQPELHSKSKVSLTYTTISGLTPHTKKSLNGREDTKYQDASWVLLVIQKHIDSLADPLAAPYRIIHVCCLWSCNCTDIYKSDLKEIFTWKTSHKHSWKLHL